MMKLYIYDHCPYCVRARMIFGLKSLPVQLCILPDDDWQTLERKIGKKMVPVLQKEDGSCMAESMDIVRYVDNLDGAPLISPTHSPAIVQWLEQAGDYLRQLLYPRFIQAPFGEFISQGARDEFRQRKEATCGSFAEYLANTAPLLERLNKDLLRLADILPAPKLSDDDIYLFPWLRNFGLLPGVNYPAAVADYRDSMAQRCCINLLNPVN